VAIHREKQNLSVAVSKLAQSRDTHWNNSLATQDLFGKTAFLKK
jgi:hypothetical protein